MKFDKFNMVRLIIALIAVVGQSAIAGELPCLFDPACHKPCVIGHQGDPGFWIPGNSMASYQRAVSLGARGVEVDVRFSSDGVPVIFHDEKVSFWTTPGCMGKEIARTPAVELTSCRLFPTMTQKLLSFEDLVRWARGRAVIQVDVKDLDKLELLGEWIRKLDARDFCYLSISVWHADQHRKALEVMGDIRLSLGVRTIKQFDDVLAWMRLPQVFMVETDGTFLAGSLTPDQLRAQIKRMREAGLKVEAVGDTHLPSVASQIKLLQSGYDAVLSYDVGKSVEASRQFNEKKMRLIGLVSGFWLKSRIALRESPSADRAGGR